LTTEITQLRLTADEYLDWADEHPGRYELVGGLVVAMAAEQVAHARAKLTAVNALAAGIAARGLPCEAMPDGVGVRVDDLTLYEPDALVRCGERTPGDAKTVSDPVVVVEVVSPSSRSVDTGIKLAGYFRLPSVRHYLVINIDARTVTHHRRDDAGGIATRIHRDGALHLDPPDLALDVANLFAGL
jgi:Uma2 family endonuclease